MGLASVVGFYMDNGLLFTILLFLVVYIYLECAKIRNILEVLIGALEDNQGS